MFTRTRRAMLHLIALLIFSIGVSSAFALSPAPPDIDHPVVADLETEVVEPDLHIHFPERYTPEGRYVVEIAPALRKSILQDFSQDRLPETHVYLLPDIATYFTARGLPPRSPHWASGLAISGENVILIRLEATPGGRVELDRTLKHELSHIALRHFTHMRPLPRWFVEGLALVQSEPWSLERAQYLIDANLADSVIPLTELTDGFPAHGNAVNLAYAESAHFMRWLFAEYGRDRMPLLTTRLQRGEPFFEAFEAVYGNSFETVEARWREDLGEGGGWFTLILGSTTLFFVIALVAAIFFWRIKRRRDRELKALPSTGGPRADPVPEHLQDFGPFSSS